MNYPLATSTWGIEELEAIQAVIDSNRFTMGEKVKTFELECAEYFGSKYAVMVNSGSSANLLAVANLMYFPDSDKCLHPGDEVIVPAVSWSTTYFPLQQYGLKLKFVDISIDDLNINIDQIEDAISPLTKAIYAVNLLGAPNDFNRLTEICKKHALYLLEDNCESMGATYNGKFTGTFSMSGSMSTFFSHHLCTMEGGIILTDDELSYHQMLSLRAHGWTRDLPPTGPIYKKSDDNFYELFRFILPGYNLRPLEMSGAIGSIQLKKLDDILKMRRQNANLFVDMFSDSDKFYIQKPCTGGNSSWFGFSLILKPEFDGRRNEFAEHLIKNNIETRPIVAGNFLNNPAIRYMDYSTHNALPNAEYLDRNGLFVGNNHYDLANELSYLYDVTQKFNW